MAWPTEKHIRALSASLEEAVVNLSIYPAVSKFSTQSPDHTIPVFLHSRSENQLGSSVVSKPPSRTRFLTIGSFETSYQTKINVFVTRLQPAESSKVPTVGSPIRGELLLYNI